MKPGAPVAAPSTGSLVVIGSSTGGTRVLTEILRALPPLPAGLVIVQHMPKFINATLAQGLSRETTAPVRIIEAGDCVEDGRVFLAPSERHCTLAHNRTFHLAPGPKVNYVCPAIDVTMQSLQRPPAGQALIGVILTGMGRDGAAGLAHMKALGALTLAQNEASCAIYGMPAEAVKLGCVDHVLPPQEIAQLIAQHLGVRAPLRQGRDHGHLLAGTGA